MPEILVEFVPDFSKLETGVEQLVSNKTISKEMAALFNDAGKTIDQFGAKFAKLGGGNTLKPAIDAAKKSIKDLSTSGIKDLGELKKRVDGITKSFVDGFGEGVEQALNDAGISMNDFNDAVKKTEKASSTLKTELRDITEQLAQMKLRGEDNSQQYIELAAKAGLYRDALGDVQKQINKTASDTRTLDTAIEFVQGVAGAFAVLQGVMALTGEESEEFQKTLLKVNAAMAILQGLQQVQNLLQKESNLIQIVSNTQRKLQVAITALDTAAQSRNIVVKGAATIAQRALNAAMEANPAFILIGVFTALAAAIAFFSKSTDNAKDIQEDFNSELERTGIIIDDQIDTLKRNSDLQIAQAKARGASEKELSDLTLGLIADENKARQAALDLRVQQQVEAFKKLTDSSKGFAITGRIAEDLGLTEEQVKRFATVGVTDLNEIKDILDKIRAVRISDVFKGFDKEAKAVNQAAEDIFSAVQDAAEKLRDVNVDAGKETAAQQQKAREDAEKARKEQEQKDKEAREKRLKDEADARQRGFEDAVAKQKLLLLQTEKGGSEELEVRKKILRAELQLALDNDKLTANQRKLLIQQFFTDQRELTEKFNADNKKKVLDDQASVIAAQLAQLNLSFDERERLLVEQLEIERQIQLSAVINNKTKEKEINAKIDKEIFEQRKKIRDEAFAEEQADDERKNFIRKKKNEDSTSDPSLEFNERRKAISDLAQLDLENFTKERLHNQQNLQDKLTDLNGYQKAAEDINNRAFVAQSNREKELTALAKEESDKRKEKFLADLDLIVGVANQLSDAFRSFQDVMNANEDARIEAQKKHLQILREGNAITEKEFVERMKKIDKIEREGKQKQAEREKALALFEATVNGASAIIKSLGESPFVIAATIALVTAQIAAIAARPIPKFGKGTDKAPKGLAQVGETGTELIHTEKGYYLAEHPQVVWFKGGEVVYNPSETKDILTPQANMTVINNTNGVSHENKIDYDKMAKKFGDEIAKHPRLIASFDEDGFSVHLSQKLNNTKYLNKRFTFND